MYLQLIVHHLQVISFSRGPFLFIFNFHPSNSYEKYGAGVEEAGEYTVSYFPFHIYIYSTLQPPHDESL